MMADLLLLRSSSGITKPALWRRRLFECKTCSRKFPTFQALGGHRTSHNRPIRARAAAGGKTAPARKRLHSCTVCGMEFLMGQALGGHMRRHRSDADAAVAAAIRRDNFDEEEKVMVLDLNLPLCPEEFIGGGPLQFSNLTWWVGGPLERVLQSKQRQHSASLFPLHKFLRKVLY